MRRPKQFMAPIFYDPSAKRWHRTKLITRILSLALFVIYGSILLSVVINPILPAVGLPAVRTLNDARHILPQTPKARVQSHRQRTYQAAKSDLLSYIAANHPVPATTAPALPNSDQVIGFFVNWDDTSFTSLKQNINSLTTLAPEWLHLNGQSGAIVLDNPARQTEVTNYVRSHNPHLAIMPLINNFSNAEQDWDAQTISQLLHTPTAQTTLITNLLNYVQAHNYHGITIDFESVATPDARRLVDFMATLSEAFHAAHLEVSQNVPMTDDAFAYQDLAAASDFLLLMAYDENASNDLAGPVASQEWFTDKLKDRLEDIPANKLVVALGNYGYDWIDGQRNGQGISFQEAITTARESEGQIEFDADTLNPTYDYVDEHQQSHRVWFLDGVTAFNQLTAVEAAHPSGVAVWRLGSEDPSLWQAMRHRQQLDQSAATALQPITYGYDIDYEGAGEILRVSQTPAPGRRDLSFDPGQGLITTEQLPQLPQSYVINRWGANPASAKKIALTFDDGPDPVYTPKILKILQDRGVLATFFVVGTNGEAHPSILKAMVAAGHEIGNHTYTHPNIAVVDPEQLTLELNANERLFESALGLRSVLFRPPYSEDVEPDTPDEVQPLVTTSRLGYYTVGMQIDPNDWKNPGVEAIVQSVLAQAQSGVGHIVLLHDSGGDRSQTVAALPEIIDRLRSHGYQLVTVSNLVGLSRTEIMPPIASSSRLVAQSNHLGFLAAAWLLWLLYWLAIIAIVLSIARLLIFGSLAIRQARRRQPAKPGFSPTVTMIVPAFNEARVIGQTLRSLTAIDYPEFAIVVVNDGSTDETKSIVAAWQQRDRRIHLINQVNAGKAAALNTGLRSTRAEIVVVVDADTQVAPTVLRLVVRHFADARVGAVAGNAKVGNRVNILTRWQALEYITSQNLERRALDALNCVTVVPGAIGAWRRALVRRASLFQADTLAEDADLTIRILQLGFVIRYEPGAIVWTEAPDTIAGFLKQRYRWAFGIMQVAWKARRTMFRKASGTLGFFGLPTLWLFQIILPLIAPIMDLVALLTVVWTMLQARAHPDHHSITALEHIAFLYALFLFVDYLAAAIAFALESNEDWSLLISLFWQRLSYRILLYSVLIRSFVAALRGRVVDWTKIERKATVTVSRPIGLPTRS